MLGRGSGTYCSRASATIVFGGFGGVSGGDGRGGGREGRGGVGRVVTSIGARPFNSFRTTHPGRLHSTAIKVALHELLSGIRLAHAITTPFIFFDFQSDPHIQAASLVICDAFAITMFPIMVLAA